VARLMLEVTVAMRSLLRATSADLAGMDLSRLTGMFATMQQLQERVKQGRGLGSALPLNGFLDIALGQLAAADPTEWPVAVMVGEEPAVETADMTERPAILAPAHAPDSRPRRGHI